MARVHIPVVYLPPAPTTFFKKCTILPSTCLFILNLSTSTSLVDLLPSRLSFALLFATTLCIVTLKICVSVIFNGHLHSYFKLL